LLRNKLFLISFVALAGCASAPVQKSAADGEKNAVAATTQQTVTPVADQAIQQPSAQAQTETKPAIQPAPQPAPADLNTINPTPVPFLAQDHANPNQPDVWQRIRNGFAMREQDSKLIARYEQWYARQPEYVARMTDRARRYLYFIVDEVEKRGMPTEIALLPMIESAFNPGAMSSARASGIWQFIPSTGKNFGMQQNWWYDGRRDVINATKGALDYLQKLHDQFGAWDLALAAYNAGENSVMRAQARNRKRHLPTNYASLKLPKETRQYVPKLLAVKNIISYPESFGLVLTEIPNKPYFSEVTTTRHIDVELAAEMAGITMEEFTALNPAHSRPVILQKEDEVLLLPVDKVETFRTNLESANQPLVSWQACPTKKGENLDEVALRYGISAEKLRSVNGIHRSIKVSNGQTLLVPLNGEQPESEFAAFNTNLPPTDNSLLNAIRHIVRRGDTLSAIARRYHVKLASLKSWNRGVRILRPGQHILVAQPAHVQRVSKTSRNIKRAAITKKAPQTTKS
jgi:membrane-bound lytic murein transglycosylase D